MIVILYGYNYFINFWRYLVIVSSNIFEIWKLIELFKLRFYFKLLFYFHA